jgi:hypothetical protein
MFQIKEGSYNTESLIGFLQDLREHFAGANVTLIWDGLPSHRSTAMKAWDHQPAGLAGRRAAARLRSRPKPDRDVVASVRAA